MTKECCAITVRRTDTGLIIEIPKGELSAKLADCCIPESKAGEQASEGCCQVKIETCCGEEEKKK